MIDRTVRLASVLIWCSGCGGAGPEDEIEAALGQIAQEVQRDVVNTSEQSTSAFVNLLTTLSSRIFGVMVSTAGNCGVTFISKHYAVTASHCLTNLPFHPTVSVGVYQPMTTNLDVSEAVDASNVSGSWPDWTIDDEMTLAEGYDKGTGYFCSVKFRCHPDHGPVQCPDMGAMNNKVDIALLWCQRNTPAYQSWTTVNTGDPTSGDVDVRWFHEVLDLARWSTDSANNVPQNNWTNYGGYNGNKSINYHYTEALSHDYLPLRSLTWDSANGSGNYRIVGRDNTNFETQTDVPACHGASGSGVFINGTSSLLGPLVGGSQAGTSLCHVWNTVSPGNIYTTYVNAPAARVLESTSEVQNDR